jgi:hypothetical protein
MKKKINNVIIWIITLIVIFCLELLLSNCEKQISEEERQEQLKKVYEYMETHEGGYSSTDLQSAKGY